MIKKLQRKFIKTAMIAITILLVVVLCVLNIFNATLTNQQSEKLLDNLVTKEIASVIQMELIVKPDNQESMQMMQTPENKEGLEGDYPKLKGRRGFMEPPINEDMQLGAIYFTVHISDNGKIAKVDTKHIASITADEAKELIDKVQFEEVKSGNLKLFKYKVAEASRDGSLIAVFMDTSVQIFSTLRVAVLSFLIGIACWLIMFGVVWFLSKKAIIPIAVNMEKQRQFVTDAGHELKTPLAVILANTEAMELKEGETKYSKNIREQVWRLNELMQNLLTLAKVDEEESKIILKETSVSGIVCEMVDMFKESAKLKNVEITQDVPPDIIASVNHNQISNLVSILMDNAVKYSPDNENIDVMLTKEDKKIVLRIKNKCSELPNCVPEKLFDRFYRGDSARTQSSGGSGIGLSAAAAIVANHKGEITAAYTGEKEITFTIILHA